jgi:glycosyltransferase involved in cell wall biosynthesis
MKVSIGIMLWNEAATIGLTIDSIFEQSLLSQPLEGVSKVEVVALANGCTDDSVPVARAALERNLARSPLPCVDARVEQLPGPNRGNAWNQFVHRLAAPDTDYIIFMDADIYINHPNALWSMVHGLEQNPYCPVAGALGLKDIDLKPGKSLWEKLSSAMTRMEHHARLTYLCGGLYCGRAGFFRRLEFPEGFVCGDDAFLTRMAITNLMTTEMQFDRVLHPADATFVFEAYTSVSRLYRQHIRRQIGRTVQHVLYDYIRARQHDGRPDAGEILRRACRENPDWLKQAIERRIADSGVWVVPWRGMFLRMSQLRRQRFPQKVLKAPLAVAGTLWLATVMWAANRRMKRGQIQGAWQNMRNTRLLTAPGAGQSPCGTDHRGTTPTTVPAAHRSTSIEERTSSTR